MYKPLQNKGKPKARISQTSSESRLAPKPFEPLAEQPHVSTSKRNYPENIPIFPEKPIQAKALGGIRNPQNNPVRAATPRMPIQPAVLDKMENAFGADFSDVRISEGSHVSSIGALAYTQGNQIHFAPGKYKPNGEEGQRALGHELTHVIQQRAGRVSYPQHNGLPINADSRMEKEADDVGKSVARGQRPPISGVPPTGIGASTSGANPIQRIEIPEEERAKPEEFMRARAHLAARLTGANTSELQTEVGKSREQVNKWQSTQEQPISEEDAQGVYNDTLGSDYSVLKRYQDEADHNKPRGGSTGTAVEELRKLHGNEYSDTPDENRREHLGAAVLGARHTKGYNEGSPFVSLLEKPEKLLESKDDGPKGAKTIAEKTEQLHTYTIPKNFTWDTKRLVDTMGEDFQDAPIEGGNSQTNKEWLESTPSEETEALFLGSDLDKYRTANERNPNLPKQKGGRKKNRRNNKR